MFSAKTFGNYLSNSTKACLKSLIRSSIFSIPVETLNIPGVMPIFLLSSSGTVSYTHLNGLDVEVIYLDGSEQESYNMDFSDIDAVVCFKFFDFNDISKFKSLKFIHTTSTGIDQMPLKYIDENGIILKNCPGVHSAPISEYVIGAVLSIYKKFDKLKKQQEKHIWECDWNLHEMINRRVCILGTGSIGSHCAKRFRAFDTVVAGVDPYPKNDGSFSEVYKMDKMLDEIAKADIVVNCIPVSYTHLDGRKHIKRFRYKRRRKR